MASFRRLACDAAARRAVPPVATASRAFHGGATAFRPGSPLQPFGVSSSWTKTPYFKMSRRGFASTVDKDPYKILGVSKDATQDEIKKRYKKLALKCHPDRSPPEKRKEAEKKFAEVAGAYEILGDSDKRKQHDLGGMGHPSGFPGQGHPGNFHPGGFHPGGSSASQQDAERMFREVFSQQGDMASILSRVFGAQQGSPAGPQTLQVGQEVRILSDEKEVRQACRASGINKENDHMRQHCLGRKGKIIKADRSDQTIKVRVEGRADVWFGAGAVESLSEVGARPGSSPFGNHFSNMHVNVGNPGGMRGGGVVEMKQQMVTKSDGQRAMRVTRVTRMPGGELREDTMETPL